MVPIREDVSGMVQDNVSYMSKAYREHFRGYFTKSVAIRCLAHIFNLVAKVFWEDGAMQPLRDFAFAVRRYLKGKVNIKRRQRLRAYLRKQGHGGIGAPPDFCVTRWAGSAAWVKWMVEWYTQLKDWIKTEDECQAVDDIKEHFKQGRNLRLLMVFFKENSAVVFDQLEHSQTRTAPTFRVCVRIQNTTMNTTQKKRN